jgi:hypothetical protein
LRLCGPRSAPGIGLRPPAHLADNPMSPLGEVLEAASDRASGYPLTKGDGANAAVAGRFGLRRDEKPLIVLSRFPEPALHMRGRGILSMRPPIQLFDRLCLRRQPGSKPCAGVLTIAHRWKATHSVSSVRLSHRPDRETDRLILGAEFHQLWRLPSWRCLIPGRRSLKT